MDGRLAIASGILLVAALLWELRTALRNKK